LRIVEINQKASSKLFRSRACQKKVIDSDIPV
jgi:hypothetical protein